MKGIFSNRSVWFQVGILSYLFLFGLVLSSAITFAMNMLFGMEADPATGNAYASSFYSIHATQFISDLFVFLLPAVGSAYLCSRTPGKFLHFRKISNIRIFILAAFMVVLILPTIDITSYLNQNIHLPEFMSSLEKWMYETEKNLTQITDGLLSEKGILTFTINIFMLAVMAGLTEEILFRGALLSIIRKKTTNPHIAIWIVAIIFSAIHFQFYGFIPRILLGAFLGYLLYWSNSIWVPIFAHFVNNAMAVTGSYIGFSSVSENSMTSEIPEMETGEPIITIVMAIVGLILFVICAKIIKRLSRE
ncbi:MAG: CPBP family intramembrane metalloprotease [Tannerella sp.]|jgi:membrane protease YdiL (CAAX protease family)|nr:CPBP family intramembrane metalloprotease [Tannerella sp.]